MTAASSLVMNTIGQYYACQYSHVSQTPMHMCVMDDIVMMPKGSPLLLTQGMCVPLECSEADVAEFWLHVRCMGYTLGPFLDRNLLPIWNETCVRDFPFFRNCSAIYKEVRGNLVQFAWNLVNQTGAVREIAVHCGDYEVTEWDAGAVSMLCICSLLGALIIINGFLELLEGKDGKTPTDSAGNRTKARKRIEPLWRAILRCFSIKDNLNTILRKEASRSLG